MIDRHDRWFRKAEKLADKNKTRQAVELLIRLTEAEPDRFFGWYRLGGLLLRLKQPSRAEKALLKALSLRPDDAPTLNQLALALLYQEKWDEANEKITTALQFDSNQARFHQTLGLILYYRGNLLGARTVFIRATHLEPLNAEIHLQLSRICERLSDRVLAEAAYREYQKLLKRGFKLDPSSEMI